MSKKTLNRDQVATESMKTETEESTQKLPVRRWAWTQAMAELYITVYNEMSPGFTKDDVYEAFLAKSSDHPNLDLLTSDKFHSFKSILKTKHGVELPRCSSSGGLNSKKLRELVAGMKTELDFDSDDSDDSESDTDD